MMKVSALCMGLFLFTGSCLGSSQVIEVTQSSPVQRLGRTLWFSLGTQLEEASKGKTSALFGALSAVSEAQKQLQALPLDAQASSALRARLNKAEEVMEAAGNAVEGEACSPKARRIVDRSPEAVQHRAQVISQAIHDVMDIAEGIQKAHF